MLFNLRAVSFYLRAKTRQHCNSRARGWSGKVHVPSVKPRFAPSARIWHISWKGAVAGGAQDVLYECAWMVSVAAKGRCTKGGV